MISGPVSTDDAIKIPGEAAQEIYTLASAKKETGYFWHEGKLEIGRFK
ncbi:oxidoreductase, short chain dehydrogenase/reductase [Legionella feeleii]|uniref:Oxidoreductase, short chain dehydrogenase/reductase n=1 Tax=Legionella feeleii TaxID=453 RepID=A0A378KT50_9GAMM|nr:oxidoreductase, short chain dehydrogenase/reductase [Legionella feeleii]